jgi:hypothetical protein
MTVEIGECDPCTFNVCDLLNLECRRSTLGASRSSFAPLNLTFEAEPGCLTYDMLPVWKIELKAMTPVASKAELKDLRLADVHGRRPLALRAKYVATVYPVSDWVGHQ